MGGSGRGDRNQVRVRWLAGLGLDASMGSGRGDRNQLTETSTVQLQNLTLQWGPVVVTGISPEPAEEEGAGAWLQWGPVVVTGIRTHGAPAVPTGPMRFNGVRSW